MSAGLILACGEKNNYVFFDSFRGLPPAEEADGPAALAWQQNRCGGRYFNNCKADRSELNSCIVRTGIDRRRISIAEGWLDDTLPRFAPDKIAVLRIDVDWYRSTLSCLVALWDRVLPGGVVILDDYCHWEGCRKAVHEFLASRKRGEAIRYDSFWDTAYIVKGDIPNAYEIE